MKPKNITAAVTIHTEVLSDQDVTTFLGELDHIAAVLGEGFQLLTPAQRKHVPKARTRAMTALPEVIKLAKEHAIDNTSIASLETKKAFLERVKPLADKVTALGHLLGDVLLQVQGDLWVEGRSAYAQLQGKAKANAALADQLMPVADAFRIAKRKPAKQPATAKQGTQPADAPAASPPPAQPPQGLVVHAEAPGTGLVVHAEAPPATPPNANAKPNANANA
jgi:hypothetical protein